ncbi:alpha/beta fold hydrolase [Mucilaginibacter polytrichastri]|uniref:AB hydrolase-1 domain-containing protein n=1 Tax=Mucilaginibacter polytrichastri TaxID=1302689 RepID=A0A1Q5ZY79_9SPHI|nr:alpha/beta fold hydrolase [Mucilaginibacter polytrichastri]OKS86698.1 hypothetical protein RG47T_2155 [Mucilaginibacter polytrichastri]SFS82325.1 Pimeloyl-ACP methyl ester carboxylesterase [Mucilaginibacter polytrichastri]
MKKVILNMLLLIGVAVFISACSKDNNNEIAPAKTYVLVHGAWQAPYAWLNVKADLERSGNKVILVELPGHGADQTAPQNLTIDVYREKVISAINKVDGKVILVGHSLAGVVISAVAEKVPSKIEKLIYIGAYLPANGQSLLDLAGTDAASLLGKSLVPSADQLTLGVVQERITDIFIQDGTADQKALVLQNYRVEPAIPFTNKVVLTDANFGAVPKYYIKTLKDQAISPELQNRMIAAAGLKSVYSINTGHSPFISKPDSVAILLSNIAR